jgi:hypothetical protein
LAIDVMITPPLPITDGDDPSTYVASTINHYQQYERKKFGGCSINTDNSNVLREQVIAALNNSSTIHQGGGKPVLIKMTLFGLYLIRYQPYLSIFESF